MVPLAHAAPCCPRPGRRAPRDGTVLEDVVVAMQLRRALSRRGAALSGRTQGPHVPADRRDRRRADDIPAGMAGWQAQLGLSLLLAPGCDPDPARAPRRRLPRGGGGLARLAVPGGGRPPP